MLKTTKHTDQSNSEFYDFVLKLLTRCGLGSLISISVIRNQLAMSAVLGTTLSAIIFLESAPSSKAVKNLIRLRQRRRCRECFRRYYSKYPTKYLRKKRFNKRRFKNIILKM